MIVRLVRRGRLNVDLNHILCIVREDVDVHYGPDVIDPDVPRILNIEKNLAPRGKRKIIGSLNIRLPEQSNTGTRQQRTARQIHVVGNLSVQRHPVIIDVAPLTIESPHRDLVDEQILTPHSLHPGSRHAACAVHPHVLAIELQRLITGPGRGGVDPKIGRQTSQEHRHDEHHQRRDDIAQPRPFFKIHYHHPYSSSFVTVDGFNLNINSGYQLTTDV